MELCNVHMYFNSHGIYFYIVNMKRHLELTWMYTKVCCIGLRVKVVTF